MTDSSFFRKIWPEFHKHKQNVHLASFYTFTDYWRIWTMSIFILVVSALSPLWFATLIHHNLIQKSIDSELILRTERLTSNAKRSIAYFIEERINALIFTANEIGYDQLTDYRKLSEILKNLKLGFGGLTDLSVINQSGDQVAYAGPFNLEGKNYKSQPWFAQSLKKDHFVSEVFTGYRDVPHIILAVRSAQPDGSIFILRATIETERLMQMLLSYKTSRHMDIFLVNRYGVLQTPSTQFGAIFAKAPLKIPQTLPQTEVKLDSFDREHEVIKGYSYISTDIVTSPFILAVLKEKAGVMQGWLEMGKSFNWIVGISGAVIIVVITVAATFLVNRLYQADRTKAETMLQMEQSQQLASIGQLAAGVAHEINNPLALINETAGYLKDIYMFDDEERSDEEIIEYIDSILEAVERCGTITKQLLGFVRQFDIKIRKINVKEMAEAVLNLHKKEAEYKGVAVSVHAPEALPEIETDSGKLQQILVNIINNAFQAIEEDGCLDVNISQSQIDQVQIVIQDTGCGIPEESLKKIHEPFFSTKQERQGTGLGLSITYGLVKKLQGSISVQSIEGVGTSFTITLPVSIHEET